MLVNILNFFFVFFSRNKKKFLEKKHEMLSFFLNKCYSAKHFYILSYFLIIESSSSHMTRKIEKKTFKYTLSPHFIHLFVPPSQNS